MIFVTVTLRAFHQFLPLTCTTINSSPSSYDSCSAFNALNGNAVIINVSLAGDDDEEDGDDADDGDGTGGGIDGDDGSDVFTTG